ncbi:putative peptidase [Altererythrobacter epoxidivorans]|uniref:Putative peptidase n=1 Tax=Altererythrobacter epoxidivorans TaxID=361183 RepID=A0A0M4MUJ4_9SPHN|nr:prolyl oligopeptidase family serine peptidase [Altererythrobacter epoxidivorans]ALE17183.1 putative peptidase [Altererythrobacter epoxidivorans]
MKFASAASILLAFVAVAPASATDLPDGTLISSEPCEPMRDMTHALYLKRQKLAVSREIAFAEREGIAMPPIPDALLMQASLTEDQLAERLAYEGFECREIRYASGGLEIAGFLWKPVDTAGEALPLIIANRGGNRDFGGMAAWMNWGWYDFLKAGYVVLASQYRGGPGSEGEDEFGGDDVDDVRALIPLAESLGYVDTANVFAFGGSRGGMMTYQLAKGDSPLRAFSIQAGVSDLWRNVENRPGFEDMYAEMMPDYHAHGREAALTRRSASKWAGEIKVPGIIFHGSDDWRVDPQDAVDVAEGMRAAGTPVELHLYFGDTHGMTLNHADMMRHTLAYFERFRTRPDMPAEGAQ